MIDSETRDSQFYSGCSVVAKNSDFVSVLGLGLKRKSLALALD